MVLEMVFLERPFLSGMLQLFRRRPAAAIFAIRRLPYFAIPAAAATAAGSRAPLFFAARSIALNRAPLPSFGLATNCLPSRPRRWCWPGRGQKRLQTLVVRVDLGPLKAWLEFGLSRRIDRRLQRFQRHRPRPHHPWMEPAARPRTDSAYPPSGSGDSMDLARRGQSAPSRGARPCPAGAG